MFWRFAKLPNKVPTKFSHYTVSTCTQEGETSSTYKINFVLRQALKLSLHKQHSKAAEQKEKLFNETLEKTVCQETQDDTIDSIPYYHKPDSWTSPSAPL